MLERIPRQGGGHTIWWKGHRCHVFTQQISGVWYSVRQIEVTSGQHADVMNDVFWESTKKLVARQQQHASGLTVVTFP